MVGAVGLVLQGVALLRSLGCDFFAVVAIASLAQKQPSPVVRKMSTGHFSFLRPTPVSGSSCSIPPNKKPPQREVLFGGPYDTQYYNQLPSLPNHTY